MKSLKQCIVRNLIINLGLSDEKLHREISDNAISRGTALLIEIESEQLTEVFTRIGERGVRAEIIAEEAADDALSYLKINAPVGPHLPDNCSSRWR